MPPDDFYWNATESESDESIREYHPLPLPNPNDKVSNIDPWDLENYAYIREHLESTDLSSNTASLPFSGSSGSADMEAHSNSFLYVPGHRNTQRYPEPSRLYDIDQGNYADIEEVRQEPRRAVFRRRRGLSYGSFEADTDESPYEEGGARGGSVFGIYDRTGNIRKVSIPVSADYSYKTQLDRSMSTYEEYMEFDPYATRHEIYSRLEDIPRNRDKSIPIYDDVRRLRTKPNNFGLTNYGHLKIDYSCNWNNLKKFIRNKH